MLKHFKVFDNAADYEEYIFDSGYTAPNISIIHDLGGVDNDRVYYNPLDTYLTFKILSGGTIVWKVNDASFARAISYKLNNGQWTSITSTTAGVSIAVNEGDILQFKGTNTAYGNASYRNTFSASTAYFDAEGNIMSLIYGDNFRGQTNLNASYAFASLFIITRVLHAHNLKLSATKLTNYCYIHMFYGSTLITPPTELPAKVLSAFCYQNMFGSSTRLIRTPELPATTLAEFCYQNMFLGCTALETACDLPATALTTWCYNSMFQNCPNLIKAPSELPATTMVTDCYRKMFSGCEKLTKVPALPAKTLAFESYHQMFYGCTSLKNITCLATNISAQDCTYQWVNGVSSTGTFVKDSNMSSWTTGVNGIPANWTVINA